MSLKRCAKLMFAPSRSRQNGSALYLRELPDLSEKPRSTRQFNLASGLQLVTFFRLDLFFHLTPIVCL
jgi:hypothetical protein